MENLIALYKKRLNLEDATFFRIDHDDAMVALVYKVVRRNGEQLILKISGRPHDYFREAHFLKYFADKLPVPRIINEIVPEANIKGAVLMEYLPGVLLKITDFTDSLAYEIGSLLAHIHQQRLLGYGDPLQETLLNSDPRIHFTMKFEEGLAECSNHLSKTLLDQCKRYYNEHIHLLESVDGPCIVHRDFRPGNLIALNGKLSGIIDWASARAGFAEEDFCSLEHTEWSVHPASRKSFLEGYTSARPVPNYSMLMPLLRLNKAIATIGFMVKKGLYESKNAPFYQLNRRFLETFFSS